MLSRISALAVAIAVVAGASTISAPAHAGKWDWLGNKPYLDCLKLWHYGDFMIPAHYNAAQRAALKEKGRRYCNRKFYGHD